MKIEKLQANLIKWALTPEHKRKERYLYSYDDERVFVLTAYYYQIIRRKDFLLDLEKVFKTTPFDSKPLTQNESKALDLKLTGKRINMKGTILLEMENESFKTYVNEKYFKKLVDDEFNPAYQFKAENRVTPVYVYEEDLWVGGVCPVRHEEVNNED